MGYNKQTREEWGKLKTYLEDEYFGTDLPKLAQKHLQSQHKNYSFPQMLSFFINYKAEILRSVKDNHHLANKINWYLENKMTTFLANEQKEQLKYTVDTDFKFITYSIKPTPPSPDYDVL